MYAVPIHCSLHIEGQVQYKEVPMNLSTPSPSPPPAHDLKGAENCLEKLQQLSITESRDLLSQITLQDPNLTNPQGTLPHTWEVTHPWWSRTVPSVDMYCELWWIASLGSFFFFSPLHCLCSKFSQNQGPSSSLCCTKANLLVMDVGQDFCGDSIMPSRLPINYSEMPKPVPNLDLKPDLTPLYDLKRGYDHLVVRLQSLSS